MVRNFSKKNNKINLKGGLNCNLVKDEKECTSRRPECLWKSMIKKCIDNPNVPSNPLQEIIPPTIQAQVPVPVPVPVREPVHVPIREPVPVPVREPAPLIDPVPVQKLVLESELPAPKEKPKIPEKFQTTFFISPQLERLSKQLGVNDTMRDTVDPEISNEELDMLLNTIKIESDKKDTLIVIADHIIQENNIKDPREMINIKIKVLLDNLAKKLCRCTGKIDSSEKTEGEAKPVSSEALCRYNIFHKRGIDYITHDCGDADLNVHKYNYKMGPLLRPFLNSSSNILLRRHVPKRK